MKYSYFRLFVVLFFVFVPLGLQAQAGSSYNLNADNGLPSNHVYGMITDRHGYLWISTDRGVVRYNGYECRLFSLSDGLPSEDIWELLEDKKGRIWLGTISDQIGYIYNNNYHKTYLKDITGTIYPSQIRYSNEGVIFHSPYTGSKRHATLCYEDNDTIYKFMVDDTMLPGWGNPLDDTLQQDCPLNDEYGRPLFLHHGNIFSLQSSDGDIIKKNSKLKIILKSHLSDSNSKKYSNQYFNSVFGDYIVSYENNIKSDTITLTNIKTGFVSKIKIGVDKKEKVQYISFNKKPIKNNPFYVITNQSIYKCQINPYFSFVDTFKLKDFIGENNIDLKKITTVHKSDFWNFCVGSTTDGLWLCNNNNNNNIVLNKKKVDLLNYVHVGTYADSISFWWSKLESKLAILDRNLNIAYYNLSNERSVKKITHYTGDTFYVSAQDPSIFMLNSGSLVRIASIKSMNTNSSVFSCIIKNKYDWTYVSTFGFWGYNAKTATRRLYDYDRYYGLVYHPLRKEYWAYNGDRIYIQGINSKEIINRDKLNSLGVKTLEKICIDDVYGNVFFKGYDNLIVYNPQTNKRRVLFNNISLKDDANVMLYDNKLIVAWKYGILFSLILGDLQVSQPIVYLNSKCVTYKTIFSTAVMKNKLYLNTDKGLFLIDIPTKEQILGNIKEPERDYRFILNYAGDVSNIKTNDTLKIGQNNRKLLFDVIHPNGCGHIRYYSSSSEDTVWQELNSNEVNLPSFFFKPDNYYRLRMYASDDSWKSDVLELNVYIIPQWWQTHTMVRLIWVGVLLLALLVIATSIFLTRRMVLRASERKHLQMEMELKSIYAQINPHFIFNSLNSALLLVSKNRVDEAYSHIAKFSRLLRSYLKSSRNKYISISEEAENLKNYIELQQTRFKDKFVYEIIIDEAIRQRSVSIPSLLIQPFVENAINHGILQKQEHGKLRIEFHLSVTENKITCTIEDDGIGRKQSKLNNLVIEGKTESYGDLMIKDLVSIFNRYEKMNIDITYTDKELPLTGTIVTITINNPRYE